MSETKVIESFTLPTRYVACPNCGKGEHRLPMVPAREIEPPLDAGIARAVEVLQAAGVETFESCEGGHGHAFPEPTVRFHGVYSDGFRALAIAMREDLPVRELRRAWRIECGEPTGPCWELVFFPQHVRST